MRTIKEKTKMNEAIRDTFVFDFTSRKFGETVEVYIRNGDAEIYHMGEKVDYLDNILDGPEIKTLYKVLDAIGTLQGHPGFSDFSVM